MPMIYQKSNGQISTFKVVLISTIVLSAAIMLSLTDFAPSIYNGVVSWLKPPYLYLLMNCIIITIVASSKFHPTKDDEFTPQLSETIGFAPPPPPTAADYKYDGAVANDSGGGYGVKVEKSDAIENEHPASNGGGGGAFVLDPMSNKENEYVVAKSMWNSPAIKDGKQPVSARFSHRRNVAEGGRTVLGVSKAKRQDTLESTWKMITEGRPVPISRHLKKSETLKKPETQNLKHKTMKKSETFSDRSSTNSNSSSPSAIKKEASLSQDELNRRVEAFINKFNQEMRLQRQHSLNQYREIIKS